MRELQQAALFSYFSLPFIVLILLFPLPVVLLLIATASNSLAFGIFFHADCDPHLHSLSSYTGSTEGMIRLRKLFACLFYMRRHLEAHSSSLDRRHICLDGITNGGIGWWSSDFDHGLVATLFFFSTSMRLFLDCVAIIILWQRETVSMILGYNSITFNQ